jgi:hypothetical protein
MTAPGPILWPLSTAAFPIPIRAHPARDAALTARIHDQWALLRARNPRFFDGPLLTIHSFDPSRGTLTLQHDTYMPYAVQPDIDTATLSLGITAVLQHHPANTLPTYLLAQRAPTTHMYPNLWELGPSGALAPPSSPTSDSLTLNHVRAQIQSELIEEIGLELPLTDSNSSPLCTVFDPQARSIDLVVLIRLSTLPTLIRNWEYQSAMWLSTADFPTWSLAHPVIPPTAAIMHLLTRQG